jgi:hypothetical protein
VVRGKNLCHLYGAGWVLWQDGFFDLSETVEVEESKHIAAMWHERLQFRKRLVEMDVYADVPHHVSFWVNYDSLMIFS